MVSFDTDGKTRRVQSAGSWLYPRTVHEALAAAPSLSLAGLKKDS
jgi:hypothetical protein